MKRYLISTAAALVVLTSFLFFADSVEGSLRQIRRMVKRKEYAEARRMLREELQSLKGKEYGAGLLLLANIETDSDKAESLYDEVLSVGDSRDRLSARLGLAKIHYALGEYRKVVDILARVEPAFRCGECYESIYLRALAWKQLREYARARREFEMIDRGDFLEWSYMALAELDIEEGRIERAIELYETIGGSHSNPIAGFKLGECYEILGNRNKAEKTYRTVIHQFPRSLEAPKAQEKLRYVRRGGKKGSREGGGEVGGARQDAGSGRIVKGPGFTLQLGAFSERENAIRLAEKLGSAVEGVRVERAEHEGRVWHRVRIGVFESRAEAEREAARLERLTRYTFTVLPLEL
jgi:tetratricopeptide (TPR) repeat protein